MCLLLACSVNPPAKVQLKPSGQTQKRITHQKSDVLINNMLDTLIEAKKPLLIPEQGSVDQWPLPKIGTVIRYEKKICQLSKGERAERLVKARAEQGLPSQFETLVLASCAPDFTPAILAMALKKVRQARDWPADYQAYFNLLERHQQALVRLEKLYDNLKQRMDATIEKLTEIEVQTQP